ncbi:MAG: HAD-superfamily hydrolase, subfamily variant 3 [Bacteroidetes bacterium]|nr:HAD-superfamily hydrolase, subfamily variant 3 [Bacteroidota bacterium]
MRYRSIIFDFDGTLVDSRSDIAGAQLWALNQLGVTHYTPEDLFPYIGKTLQVTFTHLLPPAMHHRIDEAVRLYREFYPPRSLLTTTLFPGVRETLDTLRARGALMAIASTKKESTILRVAEHFRISSSFVQLQGSDDLPYKPDPSIVRKIITDQRWDPAGTLMVGDTDNDILAGQRAGIATCAVTYGSLTEEQLRLYSPDHVIRSLPELLAIVDRAVS